MVTGTQLADDRKQWSDCGSSRGRSEREPVECKRADRRERVAREHVDLKHSCTRAGERESRDVVEREARRGNRTDSRRGGRRRRERRSGRELVARSDV